MVGLKGLTPQPKTMSTRWRPIPGSQAREEDRPRLLKDSEIDEILSQFPLPSAADYTIALHTRRQIVESLRKQLETIELVPRPDILKRLQEDIIRHYNNSLVKSGEAVGIGVGGAFGSGLTQLTLNTFSLAGEATGVGAGFKGIEVMLYAVRERKDPADTIHFLMPVNRYDIVSLIPVLVDTRVMDFVVDKGVTYEEYDATGYDGHPSPLLQWWHYAYESITDVRIPDCDYVMRLTLNKKAMYEHRVTIQQLVTAIKSDNDNLVVIGSPFRVGIIDIFPQMGAVDYNVADYGTSTRTLHYLKNYVTTKFSELRVKGVPGIKSIHPVPTTASALLAEPRRLTPIEIERYSLLAHPELPPGDGGTTDHRRFRLWKNEIDLKIMRGRGVPLNSLLVLLMRSGVKIVRRIYDSTGGWPVTGSIDDPNSGQVVEIWTYVPERMELLGLEVTTKVTPNEFLATYIREMTAIPYTMESIQAEYATLDPADPDVQSKVQEIQGKWVVAIAKDEVEKLGTYTYAVTRGSNLTEICKFPWVNTAKTHSNNIYEITNLMGAEAARTYTIHELTEVLSSSGIRINHRHITLMTDFMYSKGFPLGVRASAAQTRNVNNFLSNSTSDRTFGVFVGASLHKLTESTHSVPASIIVGEVPRIGDSAFHLFPTRKDVDRELAILQENEQLREQIRAINQKLDAGSFETALSDLNRPVETRVERPGESGQNVPNLVATGRIIVEPGAGPAQVAPPGLTTAGDGRPPRPASAPLLSAATADILRRLVVGWNAIGLTIVEENTITEDVEVCPVTEATPLPEETTEEEIPNYVPPSPPTTTQYLGGGLPAGISGQLEEELQRMDRAGSSGEQVPGSGLQMAEIARDPGRSVAVGPGQQEQLQRYNIEDIGQSLQDLGFT